MLMLKMLWGCVMIMDRESKKITQLLLTCIKKLLSKVMLKLKIILV